MNATIKLTEAKTRILSGLADLLTSRRARLDGAIERGDERAAEMNRRKLAAEEARFIELAASNDWEFWHIHRHAAPDVLFADLETVKAAR